MIQNEAPSEVGHEYEEQHDKVLSDAIAQRDLSGGLGRCV